jgi:MFS family permease
VFSRAVARGEKLKTPLAQLFRRHPKDLVLATFVMVATYALFYVMTTWILSYSIGKTALGYLGIGYRQFLVLQLVAVLFFAGMVPVSGWLADRFGRRRTLLVTTSAIVVFGLTFNLFLDPRIMNTGQNANLGLMLLFLCIGMALMGLEFGPMSAILPEMFPTNVRYTGSGVAYNISSIFGGALTPFAAVWLTRHFGVRSVGTYVSVLSVLTIIALWLSKETKDTSMDTVEGETGVISMETTR